MRTRTKQLSRIALVSLALGVAAIASPRSARAEADAFGIGDGHRGAYAAVGLDEIVNAYAPLTAAAAANTSTLTFGAPLGDPTGFVAGDLVMLWRATGVAAASAPAGDQGPLDLTSNAVEGGRVGTLELARVLTATATTLTLTRPLVAAWAADVTQVVKVPEFTTVDVAAGTSIGALPWQAVGAGFAGGVVAFLASGTLTVEGRLSADGRGFRGGPRDENFDAVLSCPNGDGTAATGYAAKGEGVVATEFGAATKGGRNNRGNGAGGGNCAENGGGGGGHAGVGGVGGTALSQTDRGGLGGGRIDYPLITRLSMGGGGGAGEQKNGVGSAGGAGGGAIFARARTIAGAGEISANGQDAANAGILNLPLSVESDGAGGGGAGGSIHLRAVTTATCGVAQTRGGKGGDTAVATLGLYGAGGGGAGGRVLIQASNAAACTPDVSAGAAGIAGTAGQSNATGGGAGQTQPPPTGAFCFSNPQTDPQCLDPEPVCDVALGTCLKCSGAFGGGTPHACTVAVEPVCAANGSCNACNGDNATTATSACQLTTSPYCFLAGPNAGACGKCATSADCAGPTHPGPACNPTIGACGAPCADDSQCKAAEWCAQGVCVAKTPNGTGVPNVPPIDGECTLEKGKRVCLSAVCEEVDDLCGLKNGSPCDGLDERCRSSICFPADKLCGKPTGEPCAAAGECRSEVCTNGVCAGCREDTDCLTGGTVCDKDKNQCVPGCREVGGKSKCLAPLRCSKTDGTIGQCVHPAAGGDGGLDGGTALSDDSGIIEGGGCACRASIPASGSPFAAVSAAVAALLVARRRRQRREEHVKNGNAGTNDKDQA